MNLQEKRFSIVLKPTSKFYPWTEEIISIFSVVSTVVARDSCLFCQEFILLISSNVSESDDLPV